jgi:hypothetical protein
MEEDFLSELLQEYALPDAQVRAEFDRLTNMSRPQLRAWLRTDKAKSVGALPKGAGIVHRPGQGRSVGYSSGERILEIKGKKASELTPEDYAHMRKVVGYCRRHLAQRPRGDIENSRWRYSLMNWGHDPLHGG